MCLAKFLAADEIKTKFIESEDILRAMTTPIAPVQIKVEPDIEPSLIQDVALDQAIKEDPFEDVDNHDDFESTEAETEVKVPKQEPDGSLVPTITIKSEHPESPVKPKRVRKKRHRPYIRKRPEKKIQCESCPEIFAHDCHYRTHLSQHRKNNDPPFQTCSTCGYKLYSSEGVRNHERVKCTALKFFCWYCKVEFSKKKVMLEHMADHISLADSKFHCNYEDCTYSCPSALSAFYHLSSHYAPLNYVCQICSVIVNNHQRFQRHMKRHERQACPPPPKRYECDHCGRIISSGKANLIRHIQIKHQNRRFKCSLCPEDAPKDFPCFEAMQLHKVREHGVEKFKCRLCGKGFPYSSQLKIHERSHFGMDRSKKPKVCPHCFKDFSCSANMRRHVLIVHNQIRRFECPFEGCNASFGQKSQQIVHYRSQHSGEKPLVCSEAGCEARFSDPSVLYRHMRNVHKISGRPRKKIN
jgi:KRAB domain-containing zinc finger protein